MGAAATRSRASRPRASSWSRYGPASSFGYSTRAIISAAIARSGSGLSAAWVKLWTSCGRITDTRITQKKGGAEAPPIERTKRRRSTLPGDAEAGAHHPRRHGGLDVVGDRGILRAAHGLDRVVVADVEDVDRGNQANGSELHRALDMEIEVLEVRQPALAHVVEQHRHLAGAVGSRRAEDEPFVRVALTRVVERRHVHAERRLVHAAQFEQPL